MQYGKQLRSIDEQLSHFAKEHDSGGVDVCLRVKELDDELTQLKKDAYLMRVIIHEQGLHDWQPEPKARIEKILYGDGDKLIGAD